MNGNPYEPPKTTAFSTERSPFIRSIARLFVLIYGILFTLFCIAGTIDDVVSREPIYETVFWLAMSVLTCYGVFALAIRSLRMPLLHTFWRYFAYVLPILTYLGAAWEIYHGPKMPMNEFLIVFTIFVIVTTPGLVFNWMLKSRIHRRTQAVA